MRYTRRLGLLPPAIASLAVAPWLSCSPAKAVDGEMDVGGGPGVTDAGDAGGEAGPCTPRNSFAPGVAPLDMGTTRLPVAKDARTFFAPGYYGDCPRGGVSFLRLTARSAALGASAPADSDVAVLCTGPLLTGYPQAVAFSPSQSLVGLAFRDNVGYLLGTFIAPDDPDWEKPAEPIHHGNVGYYPALEAGTGETLPADAWGATFDGQDMVVAGGDNDYRGFIARFSRGALGAVSVVGFQDPRVAGFKAIAPNKSGGTWVVGRGVGAGALVLAKVTQSNTLDVSWGTGGLVELGGSDIHQASLGVDEAGRIVVGYISGKGGDTQLLRVMPDGNLDVAYGGSGGRVHVPLWNRNLSGIATSTSSFSIAVGGDGTVLVAGGSKGESDPAFIRLDATGRVDAALGVVKPPGASERISESFAVSTPPTAGCPGETLIAIGRGGFFFR